MAYSFVGQVEGINLSGDTATTASRTSTSGNFIIGAVNWLTSGGAITTATVTDNKGNKCIKLGPVVLSADGSSAVQLFCSFNITGGAGHTWTVNPDGTASGSAIVAYEYSGLATAYAIDAYASRNQSGATAATDNITSGADSNVYSSGVMVWGFNYPVTSSTASTAGTGYTSRTAVWDFGSGGSCRAEDKRISSGTGSQNATWTGATGEHINFLVVVKESPGDTVVLNQQLTDNFSGSSGTDVTIYNSNWVAPNVTCNLKGSNQVGASVFSGATLADYDSPLYRRDFLPAADQYSRVTVNTVSGGDYGAVVTRCQDSPGFINLSHYGYGGTSTSSTLYVQLNGTGGQDFVLGPGLTSGDRIGLISRGKIHHAELNGVIVMIASDGQLTNGYYGTGVNVSDGTDNVRISNWEGGAVGSATAPSVTSSTPSTFANGATGIVVAGSNFGGAGNIVISPSNTPDGETSIFAAILSRAATLGTNGTSNVMNKPPGGKSGDLLLHCYSHDRNGSATAIAASTGWTDITNASNGTVVGLAIFARVLDGGANDACTITSSNNDFACSSLLIRDHGVTTPSTDIATGTAATGNSATPNPPNCNPAVTKDWLWIEVTGCDDDENTANFASANFTGIEQVESAQSTTSCMTQVAFRKQNASSQDPGNMAQNVSQEWVAQTLGIPPRSALGAAVGQTETSQSGTSITFTSVQSALATGSDLSLFVQLSTGEFNFPGYTVQFSAAGGTTTTKTMTETTVLSDQGLDVTTRIRLQTDSSALSDGLVYGARRGNISSDGIVTSDGSVSGARRGVTANESLALSDNGFQAVRRVRQASDALDVTDGFVSWRRIARVSQDTIDLLDGFSRSVTGTGTVYGKVMSDGLSVTDGVVSWRRLKRLMADNADILDSFSKTLLGVGIVYAKVMSDVTTLIDDNGQRWVLRKSQVSDAIGLSDALLRALGRIRILGENLEFSDGAIRFLRAVRVSDESLDIADELIRSYFADQIFNVALVFGHREAVRMSHYEMPIRFGGH